jgi:peptide/nickel transport system ATP-binding protein/oligopeptide transport system ATP-binding protein
MSPVSPPGTARQPALAVTGLVKQYRVTSQGRARLLTAVGGVDLHVSAGETLALVGESGSGKSTVARCITRLTDPTSGTVQLGDLDLTSLPKRSLWKAYRDIQMVFQDPSSSLNPRMTTRAIIEEPLRLHSGLNRAERDTRIRRLLADVRLDDKLLDRYPRQLSGGQRQRIGIARALAIEPSVLLLDEPTASLDVSVRGQVLGLLRRVQRERNLGYLLISHDLEAVRKVADRVAVMYLGKVVEQGAAAQVFENPAHPYTRALLSSAMTAEYGRTTERFRLSGEIPSPMSLPPGCRLAPRCPLARLSCTLSQPETITISPGHLSACPVTVGQEQENL